MSAESPTYDELFQRNIGVLDPGEQERLRRLKVAIAGCGGIGGAVAFNLARHGVGEIRLADPETFDASNINRQYGAFVDTIGVNKAEAIATELRRINPGVAVKVLANEITTETVGGFIRGCDVVVDGIEFFHLDAALALHAEAERQGIWVVTGQIALEVMTFTSFDPSSHAFAGMVCEAGEPSVAKAIHAFVPRLPRKATPEAVAGLVSGRETHVPSHAPQQSFGAAFIVDDLVRQFARRLAPRAVAPDLYLFDMESLSIEWLTATQ